MTDPNPKPERFPLGVPVNRRVTNNALRPVPGRPGWWVDVKGVERYIEPNAPRPPGSIPSKESPR